MVKETVGILEELDFKVAVVRDGTALNKDAAFGPHITTGGSRSLLIGIIILDRVSLGQRRKDRKDDFQRRSRENLTSGEMVQ